MDQTKRAILAAVLMAAVLMLYQMFLVPSAETPPAPPPAAEAPKPATPRPEAARSDAPPKAAPPKAAPVPSPPVAVGKEQPRPPQRLVTVESPIYRAVVSSEGGKLQELTLKYRGEKPMVVVGDLGPSGLAVGPQDGPLEVVPMQVTGPDSLRVGADQPRQDLVLEGEQAGVRVRETLTFHADRHVIDIALQVQNATGAPRTVNVALPWVTRQDWKETKAKEKFYGQQPTEIVWASEGRVRRADNLCELPTLSTDGSWIGTGTVFYMAAFIPRTEGFKLTLAGDDKKVCEGNGKAPVGRATIAVQATPTLAPGQAWDGKVTLFAGPKEYDQLKALGLEGAMDFGGFLFPQSWTGGQPVLPMAWLGIPILLLMNWVYDYVGNYGVAIILLTILSKVLFYPLTVKSMRSMKAMQVLQPQINSLRSKYRSDPQRLQRETMELYRQHKVNPLGGCLPMLAQLPIFYGLYLALSLSVELQNASFLCFGRVFGRDVWICDLAAPDPTYVLPVLMGITMFVQQKMTPTAGDPRQAQMMLMMPIVFSLMFIIYPLASGLVLYWTVSNVLQIVQQWYMDRPKTARATREAKDASRA